ncbi:hypothetical protein [Mesorhizobium sp. B2-3-5]|uniref:hypothetical protein n=1 Tax=Mesorhizobium sp. B2-3-5 TaxID=2589958 RepID=UPI0011298406|nr:hypothetical protein [Mesorhizobium sp. B2-3-5]TPM32951.1 hypothetical protein FJ958_09360 [Mesorhizobium sp. B2-3-5]
MLAYYDANLDDYDDGMARWHPWTVSETNPDHRYTDFRGLPRQSVLENLEDVRPLAGTEGAEAALDFLIWANAEGGTFETNDFGMKPPHPNTSRASPMALQQSARVSVFFRDLERNVPLRRLEGFGRILETELKAVDPLFNAACWGWCLWAHGFAALKAQGRPSCEVLGSTLCLYLWAWGDTADEVNLAFKRAFENLRNALQTAAAKFQ